MKKTLILSAALLACAAYSAAPSVEKVERSYHKASKLYGRAEYFQIRNDRNSYLIYFQWTLETAKASAKVLIGMPEPVFWQGFISRDFTRLTVNGISSAGLEPKSITPFTEKGIAGIDAVYNFDGVKMNLRFFMNEASPMLFMEWRKLSGSQEELRSAELAFSVYPSYSVPNGGKRDPRYQREILTPARKIPSPANTAWVRLQKTDTALVMYDNAFEPSNTPKAQGPCFLAIDWKGISSGKVWFGKIYCMNFRFTLDPKAEAWRFGLWETKKPMNNSEFLEYRKNNASLFQMNTDQKDGEK